MLGKRVMKNGKLEWEWITYEQAFEISDNVSQAIRKLGIEIGDKSNIGIYSKNRPEVKKGSDSSRAQQAQLLNFLN